MKQRTVVLYFILPLLYFTFLCNDDGQLRLDAVVELGVEIDLLNAFR
jgi:hypothetical protein